MAGFVFGSAAGLGVVDVVAGRRVSIFDSAEFATVTLATFATVIVCSVPCVAIVATVNVARGVELGLWIRSNSPIIHLRQQSRVNQNLFPATLYNQTCPA
jgi:hypothetical protein